MNKFTIDIVATDDRGECIFFGSCRVDGNKFSDDEVNRLLEDGKKIQWGMLNRREYFGLFSFESFNIRQSKLLLNKNITCISIGQLIDFNRTTE